MKSDASAEKPIEWPLDPVNVQGRDRRDVWSGERGRRDGRAGAMPGIEVCGKTGSAQLASADVLKAAAAGQNRNMKDNAWFVGFAPASAPEIVVVALFEHGVHGHLAGAHRARRGEGLFR